ncbi:MAG: uroporphyrinogen decarboxylase family protein [Caldicoprobacterales bacterium]
MTAREMVRAAIDHKEMGRVPYCIGFAADAYEKYKNELTETFLTNDMKNAMSEGILEFYEALSLSIGNHVFYTHEKPWWDWYSVPKNFKEDFDAPDYIPQTRGSGSYEKFGEKLRFIKETTDRYILVTVYGSHFEKANFCRGIQNFLGDLAGNKDFASKLLNTIIRKNLVMLENILSYDEIDGILLGSDWGSQQTLLMSPDTWRELIAPGELKEYELIKSANKDIWIHSCGNIELILPDLIDMGIDVLNPLQPEAMDIYKIKETYGDKLCFWGGISTQKTLPYGTSDEVRQEVKQVITYMSRGGGYITAPAQEIQSDVPFDNILALLSEAKSYS